MDAYTYLAQGRVFANAQSGNIVLFGVNLASGNLYEAMRHLPPVAAYSAGYATIVFLRTRVFPHASRLRMVGGVSELILLFALTLAGHQLPSIVVVTAVSFVAAVQHSSFTAVGVWQFNSAMTTGNLREAVSGLVLWRLHRDEQANRRQFFVLGAICLMFALGGLIGGLVTLHYSRYALGPCLPAVATAVVCSHRNTRQI